MEEERKDIIEETAEEVVEVTTTDDEEVIEGYSIMTEDSEDDVEIDEEDIDFPEYYTTTLVGSTTVLCIDEESGEVVPRTLDEIAMAEDPGDIFVYSVDKSRTEIIKSEIDLVIPEEDESKLYKITFTNGLEIVCGGSTHLLMCNNIWYPVHSLETEDYTLGIKFNQNSEITSDTSSGIIVPSVLEIQSIEKIENSTEHTYGILSENCNILIPKVLSDKEIVFAIVQQ